MADNARDDGTWERSIRKGLWRRLTLRRADGDVYLDRWGIAHERIGGILLHRMRAPDPGIDLHDHPWWFASIVLWGGYTELRADVRDAQVIARAAERFPATAMRGVEVERRPGSIRTMRLDECHTVATLRRRSSWTLVIRGPRRRSWGFYLPTGYVPEAVYDATVRAERRDLWSDQRVEGRPW